MNQTTTRFAATVLSLALAAGLWLPTLQMPASITTTSGHYSAVLIGPIA